MSDHIEQFWNFLATEHVRILLDIRRDHDEGQPPHWDSASFGNDVAKALVAQRGTSTAMNDGWRCFYCSELFTDRQKAEAHFGHRYDGDPNCVPDKLTAQAWASRVMRSKADSERFRAALQFVIDGYHRIDINHQDYRIGVYRAALDATDRKS
jgi:hypothetical protein